MASVMAYSLAWSYEAGYARTFGIPLGLIRVEETSIILSLLGLAFVGLMLYGLVNAVYPIVAQQTGPVRRVFIRHTPTLAFYGAFLIIYGNVAQQRLWWFKVLIACLLLILAELGLPLITRKDKKSYPEKLEAQEKASECSGSKTFADVIICSSDRFLIARLILLIVVLHIFANGIGNAEALGQRDFLVLHDQPSSVVLRIYGSTFVCGSLDPNAREVGAALILRENSAEVPLQVAWKRVGPLKRKALDD